MPKKLQHHDVMVVAEMPDAVDDRFGATFSNKLNQAIAKFFEEKYGFDTHYAYAVKCKKTHDKQKLKPAHIKTCATNYLQAEIAAVKPNHIVCFGSGAYYAVTGKATGFSAVQGQRVWSEKHNAWLYPTYHNVPVMFNVDKRNAMWNELNMYARMIQGEKVEFNPPVRLVTTLKGLRKVQRMIRNAGGKAAADTETQGLDMFIDGLHVRCIQLCWDETYGGVFIPLGLAEEVGLYDGTRTVTTPTEQSRLVYPTDENGVRIPKAKGHREHFTADVTHEKKIKSKPFWADGETLEQVVEILREILLETKLAWHNGKFDRKWLYMWGLRRFGKPILCPKIWCDTQHLAHLLNENRDSFKLKKLIVQELGVPSYDIPDKLTLDLSILIPYSTNDTVAGFLLVKKYLAELRAPGNEKLWNLYFKVIRPMDEIYTEIELEGWPIDVDVALAKEGPLEVTLRETIEKMDEYLEDHGIVVDHEDTKRYTSSDKLAKTIFEDLALPIASDPNLALTDDGTLSTEADALLHIRNHEWIKLLSKNKKLTKALTTYIRPMIQQGKARGKLSTSYRLSGTATGRSASGKEDSKSKKGSAMNLQNIPRIFNIKEVIRIEDNPLTGQRRLMGENDLSQVELRILAEASRDPMLVWAYDNGVDLHTYRAIRNLRLDTEILQRGLDAENWDYVLNKGAWSKLSEAEQNDARKKAKPCIAYGSLVLTPRGLVPIQDVHISDKVWDGVAWVKHDGVVCKGYKEVVTYQGLTATPDHEVYLENGQKVQFKDVIGGKTRYRIAVTEVGGMPIKGPNSYRKTRTSTQEKVAQKDKALVYDIVNAGPRNRFTVSHLLVSNCNFGFAYGMWWKKFITYAAKSYDLDFSSSEASGVRELYFNDHAGLLSWYKRVEATGKKYGYVESMSGRKRRLPALKLDPTQSEEKKSLYKAAVRQAINSPIQSFGSGDYKLMAIIGARAEMIKRGWYKTKMMFIGEIHDSAIYWADEDIIVEVAEIISNVMRHPPLLDTLGITLRVPIESDAAFGPDLGHTLALPKAKKLSAESGIPITETLRLMDYAKAKAAPRA